MEVNVTCLVTTFEPSELSGSVAELGNNAGPETWANSVSAAKEAAPILATEYERHKARRFFAEFGAWDREEIAAWSDTELDALVLQFAAGDLRELENAAPGDGLGNIDWTEAEALAEAGRVAGNLFVNDGQLFIHLSN